jgi:hypothetical protein
MTTRIDAQTALRLVLNRAMFWMSRTSRQNWTLHDIATYAKKIGRLPCHGGAPKLQLAESKDGFLLCSSLVTRWRDCRPVITGPVVRSFEVEMSA